jgi:acetyl-CoA hydrolase
VSRIVAQLSGPVSTPRADAGLIVTEHGVADLRGRTLAQRVRLMIDIAAPGHRADLERDAQVLLRQRGAVFLAQGAAR